MQPSIDIYRRIKKLLGDNWEKLRPALMKKVGSANRPDVLVDIHLEDEEWDAAIAVAEKQIWGYNLLEKVADKVTPHRPDWVIHIALKQADALIIQTQSKLYPAAAKWLEYARKAYLHKGRQPIGKPISILCAPPMPAGQLYKKQFPTCSEKN